MAKRKTLGLITGMLIFIIGLAIGLAYNGLAALSGLDGMSFWGYPEVIGYDSTIGTDARLKGLKCPSLITNKDTGIIRIKVNNPTDKQIKPWVQAMISMPGEPEQLIRDKQELLLDPGETKVLTWQVSSDNRINDRVVIIRIYLLNTQYHPPSITRHCGIIALDLDNLTGNQVLAGFFSASLIGMAAGVALWWHFSDMKMRRTRGAFNIMIWVGIITILSTLSNVFAWWLMSALLLIILICLIVSIFENFSIK
ncbi:MAG: hypothetical protein ABIG43_06815 [Chloroflexota bacterium]